MLTAAMNNLRTLVDVNTIIGDPITPDANTTIIPISKVTFGFGVGGSDIPTTKPNKNFGGGSGAGVTIQPIGFIVINSGKVELLQLASGGNVAERMVNMVPGVVDKISGMVNDFKNKGKEETPTDTTQTAQTEN